MNQPSNEEISAVQLPPQVLKVIRGIKGEYHANSSDSLENITGPLIYIIKSLMLRMQQLDDELKEAKKPATKPVPKKPKK